MSPLTKAFVILVTLLSVLLVALIVPFVAKTDAYEAQIQDLNEQIRVAQTDAASVQRRLTEAQSRQDEQLQQFQQERAALTQQLNDLRAARDQAQAEAQAVKADAARQQAELSRLSTASLNTSNLLESVTQDLQKTREALVGQQGRLIQLADRNTELSSQLDSLERQVRRFREQTVSLEEENRRLDRQLAAVPEQYRPSGEETATATAPSEPVVGEVTGVDTTGDVPLVQVNLGKSDGLAPNMELMVHRDDQYIGRLVLDKVDADQAAGRLELIRGTVQVGDNVSGGGSTF